MAIKLEIESVFKITNRGQYVLVRQIDPTSDFFITEKSFLGSVELARFLEVPRKLDENGNQQKDIYALQLKKPEDASKLIPGSVTELIPGDEIHFLIPWHKYPVKKTYLEEELLREISEKHILYGKKVNAIAHRQDCDDVLFELTDDPYRYAVVHLTWRIESNPEWPSTSLYKDWLDLYNNCIVPDHIEFDDE